MKVLLVGSDGSMGKRYQAILKRMGAEVMCKDKYDVINRSHYDWSDRAIIATPTKTHVRFAEHLISMGNKPILCEKPISKNLEDTKHVLEIAKKYNVPFEMTRQYEHIYEPGSEGKTFYDFYNTGKDGLIWDCIQIIGLARGEVRINNESPVWDCQINGVDVSEANINQSYVSFMNRWVNQPSGNFDDIFKYHNKTKHFEVRHGRDNHGLYWDPSKI